MKVIVALACLLTWGRTSGDKNMLPCSHFYLKWLLFWFFLWKAQPAVTLVKSFRLRMQRRQVRGSLRRGLGEEWRPLLLVEHRQEELDWRWGLLPEGRRSLGLCHLWCHLGLRPGGREQKRPAQLLARGQRHWGGGRLEVGRLQSLGSHILGAGRTKSRAWALLGA